jgi:transcriptional regulator
MPLPTDELLQGTLDLLILRTLTREPMHGWAVSHRIQEISRDTLRVNQGSLYPALHRLDDDGLVKAEWGVSELGRRAKFYTITAAGRRQLARETDTWRRFADAVQLVLRFA